MEKVNNKRKWSGFIYLFLFLFCFYATDLALQNDTFYTIKIGEWILEHGIDFKDAFSFHNLPYTYPHWLFDILIYLMYKLLSWPGVHLIVISVMSIISFIFYNLLVKESNLKFFSLFVTLWFINFFTGFICARAQVFTYLFFLLEYLALSKYTKTLNRKYLYILPILSLLISNFHCAVLPVFYVLFLPYLVSYVIGYKFKLNIPNVEPDFKVKEKNKYIKHLLVVIIISFLTSCINPTGIHAHTYMINTFLGNTTNYIVEHLPTTINSYLPFYIFLFIFIIVGHICKIKYHLSDFFIIIGFLLMGFMSVRHTSFAILFGMLIVFRYLFKYLEKCNTLKYDNFFSNIVYKGRYLIITILLVLSGMKLPLSEDKFIVKEFYPVKACDYILENFELENTRFYNEYGIGSYMLYREIPVFIDSRSDLYTKPFNKKINIFDDYMDTTLLINKEIIEKYDFDYGLTSKEDKTVYEIFKEYYSIEYEDDDFVIFDFGNMVVKNEEENNK